MASGAIPATSVEAHFHSSLLDLLAAHGLSGLLPAPALATLATAWSRLRPWPDSPAGLRALNASGRATATLSNGSAALLTRMAAAAGLPWTAVLSAEDFGSFKPDPRVYRGGVARMLGAEEMGRAAMVATHLGDLKAAKALGMRVVYVERTPREEEAWGDEEVEAARREGWVDLWVKLGEGGLEEVARRLGEMEE